MIKVTAVPSDHKGNALPKPRESMQVNEDEISSIQQERVYMKKNPFPLGNRVFTDFRLEK